MKKDKKNFMAFKASELDTEIQKHVKEARKVITQLTQDNVDPERVKACNLQNQNLIKKIIEKIAVESSSKYTDFLSEVLSEFMVYQQKFDEHPTPSLQKSRPSM